MSFDLLEGRSNIVSSRTGFIGSLKVKTAMSNSIRTGTRRLVPRLRYVIHVLAAVVLACAVVTCDKGHPTAPGSGPGGPSTTTGTVVSIQLSAPASIAPGESVQLTATGVKSDGSLENVTAQAQWSSSNSGVVAVSSAGVARGVANGEANIRAQYQSQFQGLATTKTALAHTFVLPTGTYRLTGHVSDGGFLLEKATVTVISGIGEGLTAVTNSVGSYALYGVGGTVRIQAKKEGYANRIETLDAAAQQAFDFALTPEQPRPDLTGTYALTIAAVPCRSAMGTLPEAATNRSYTATAAQDGPLLTLTLSGADFIVTRGRGNHFDGYVEPDGTVTFRISDAYYYYYTNQGQYDLVERFSDTSALLVSGIATAKTTPSGLSGVLSGAIELARGNTAPFASILAYCSAEAHHFDMIRR